MKKEKKCTEGKKDQKTPRFTTFKRKCENILPNISKYKSEVCFSVNVLVSNKYRPRAWVWNMEGETRRKYICILYRQTRKFTELTTERKQKFFCYLLYDCVSLWKYVLQYLAILLVAIFIHSIDVLPIVFNNSDSIHYLSPKSENVCAPIDDDWKFRLRITNFITLMMRLSE